MSDLQPFDVVLIVALVFLAVETLPALIYVGVWHTVERVKAWLEVRRIERQLGIR